MFKQIISVLVCVAAVGCGSQDGTVVAKLGWRFNYRNYTARSLDESPNDLRLCNNVGGFSFAQAYEPVATVRVLLEDPSQQSPNFDVTYDCKQAEAQANVQIHGLLQQPYKLTMQGLSEEGMVLYQYIDPLFDLSTTPEVVQELRAATGEMRFTPQLSGQNLCDLEGAQNLRVRYVQTDAAAGSAVFYSYTMPNVCPSSMSPEVNLRHIPTQPKSGVNGAFINTRYQFFVELLNTSNEVLACGTFEQAIAPGNGSFNQNPTLFPGPCSSSNAVSSF